MKPQTPKTKPNLPIGGGANQKSKSKICMFLSQSSRKRHRKIFPILLISLMFVVMGSVGLVSATVATGGTITTDGDYTIHTFKSSDTFTVTSDDDVEYLVVAGGGGGGGQCGGGGGAGGLLTGSSLSVTATEYNIIVGAGGAAGVGLGVQGGSGGNSTFHSINAAGGGGGGAYDLDQKAGDGGSGGGCGYTSAYGKGYGIVGQGHDGGLSGIIATGGGGGGAGSVGLPSTSYTAGGPGGDGISNAITGSTLWYAGGGGGGNNFDGTAAPGGSDVGGNGGYDRQDTATAGMDYRGGGGGGGANVDANGKKGGSGIVIIRYIAEAPENSAPTTTLETPADNNYSSTQEITFNCSAVDSDGINGLKNITLYGNWSGGWHANETKSLTGTSDSETFDVNISDGIYLWNCFAYDDGDLSDWADANRTLTIDTTSPLINITYPLNNSNHASNTIDINYTVSDTNLDSCWYSNDTYSSNTTLASCINITDVTWAQGQHNLTIWANDSAGNENSSSVTFFIDSIAPLIDFEDETENNNTAFNRNYIYVNVSVTETNEDTITFLLFNSTGQVNSTSFTDSTRTINWTNLPDENYYYNVTINDTSGHSNTTETRTILLDTTSPTSSITLSRTVVEAGIENITINWTAYDLNLDYKIMNISYPNGNLLLYNLTDNATITEPTVQGTYEVWVFVNDSAGNTNTTNTTFLVQDTVNPTWSNNKTNSSDSTRTGETVYFNVTLINHGGGGYQIFSFYNGTDWVNDSAISWEHEDELEETRTITADKISTIQWFWWFNDTAGNSAVTDTWSFTVADTPPTIPAVELSPATIYTNTNITCTASGSTDADNDEIIYYYKFNESNDGTLQDWSTTNTLNCSISGCDKDDDLYCYVKAVTSDLNSSLNSTHTTITNTAPTVSQILIAPLTPTTGEQLKCNYTIADNDTQDTLFNVSITWDVNGVPEATWDETIENVANDTINQSTNGPTIEAGKQYRCAVTPTDEVEDGTKTWSDFSSSHPLPNATTTYPDNETWYQTGTGLKFNFTASDETDGIDSCTLYINEVEKGYQGSVTENQNYQFSPSPLGGENTYTWYVNCTDNTTSAHVGQSEIRTIYVDENAPVSTIDNQPAPSSDPTPEILFTLNDSISPTLNYTVWVNSSATQQTGSVNNATQTALQISPALDVGYHEIIVQATDLSGRTANSSTLTVQISPPVVYLQSPTQNQVTGDNVNFTFYIDDSGYETSNCSLYINGVLNQTNETTLTSNYDGGGIVNVTFEVLGLSEGDDQNYTINCINANPETVNDTWDFHVDTTSPAVVVAVDNQSIIYNVDSVTIDANISDLHLDNYWVAVQFPDGTILQNSTTTDFTLTKTSLTQTGRYNVTAYADDERGATNTSTTYFNVTASSPVVTLNSPADSYSAQTNNIILNYSITSPNDDQMNCTIYGDTSTVPITNINQTYNNSDSTLTYNWSLSSDDTYYWRVMCVDLGGESYSNIRSFTVDVIPYTTTLAGTESPDPITYGSTTTLRASYISDGTALENAECNVTFDYGDSETFNLTYNAGSNKYEYSLDTTEYSLGTYDLTYRCSQTNYESKTDESSLEISAPTSTGQYVIDLTCNSPLSMTDDLICIYTAFDENSLPVSTADVTYTIYNNSDDSQATGSFTHQSGGNYKFSYAIPDTWTGSYYVKATSDDTTMEKSFAIVITSNVEVDLCIDRGWYDYCGDGTCDYNEITCETYYGLYTNETYLTCSRDCSVGDDICDADENPANSPNDCDASCSVLQDCIDVGLPLTWDCNTNTKSCYLFSNTDGICNSNTTLTNYETAANAGLAAGLTDCATPCTTNNTCVTAGIAGFSSKNYWCSSGYCSAHTWCGDSECNDGSYGETVETVLTCGINQGKIDCLQSCDSSSADGGYSDCSAQDNDWDCGVTGTPGDAATSDVGINNNWGLGATGYYPEGNDICYLTTHTDNYCNAFETITTYGASQSVANRECFRNCTTDLQCVALNGQWQCGDSDRALTGEDGHGIGYCYSSSCGDSVCDASVSYSGYTSGENYSNCGVNQGKTDCMLTCAANTTCTNVDSNWYCDGSECLDSTCGDGICSGDETNLTCGHAQEAVPGTGGDCNYCDTTDECVALFGTGHICSSTYSHKCIDVEICDNSIDDDGDTYVDGDDADCGGGGGIVSGTEWDPFLSPYLEVSSKVLDNDDNPYNQKCSANYPDDWNTCTTPSQCDKDICCYFDIFHGSDKLNTEPYIGNFTGVDTALVYVFIPMNSSWQDYELVSHFWCDQTYGGATTTLFHDAAPVGHVFDWRGSGILNIEAEAVSPIYVDTNIRLEMTFKDGIGLNLVPDTINITIYDSNNNVWDTADKNNVNLAQGADNVWIYSKSVGSSPATGMYSVHITGVYDDTTTTATPVQFRVATGGPYQVVLSCPDSTARGSSMSCTVAIEDEGEATVESTCTTWIDLNNDKIIDSPDESQTSFSKETNPQDTVTQSTSLNIPASTTLGSQIIRTSCSYANSAQPDSTASDTVTITEAAADTGGDTGGGSSGGGGGITTPSITGKVVEGLLFDVKVKILEKYREVFAGESIVSEITLYNFGETDEEKDITVIYYIQNSEGELIGSKSSETVAVRTKTDYIKEFFIPKHTESGEYEFVVEAEYACPHTANETDFSSSSSRFTIIEEEPSYSPLTSLKFNWLWIIIPMGLIILFLIILLFKRRKKKKSKVKTKRGFEFKLAKTKGRAGYKGRIKNKLEKIRSKSTLVVLSFIIISGLFIGGNNITGFVVGTGKAIGQLSGIIYFVFIISFLGVLSFVYRRKIKEVVETKRNKKDSNSLKGLIKKKVYSEEGDYIGKVDEVLLGENKIDSLRIKLEKKQKFKIRGVIIKYKNVKSVGHIVIVNEAILEKLNI